MSITAAVERADLENKVKDRYRLENTAYGFIASNARVASRKYGVKSISLVAVKT